LKPQVYPEDGSVEGLSAMNIATGGHFQTEFKTGVSLLIINTLIS
jgi:hypothetical protein